MDEPKSLDSLFKEKIFRIPDYQRGYAWGKDQLKDFWEDLINLSGDRSHYTGVLTLKEVSLEEISDNEYWLIEDYSYKMFHIVDGQQRLTTFVVFLQAFIEFVKGLKENAGKSDKEIYITDTLTLEAVISRYLYETKPSGDQYRTYKFGYMVDNPSYEYLRYRIFRESGPPSIKETFYTLNLRNAKQYFYEQLRELHLEAGLNGAREIYKKLTKRFLFNEYVIKDEFDVFVAFETMNNRGKQLSDLEKLKNRLIYLTTLYTDEELDAVERRSLREAINDAWKEVYYQLGRNDKHPLNDDDFLKAHWIMYFQYSRQKSKEYIKFLLDELFSPHKVHKKMEHEVVLDLPQEQRSDFEGEDDDDREEKMIETRALLQPIEIKEYVETLKAAAVHWFNSHYPYLATGLSEEERHGLDRLNRIGMIYFRPLVVSVLKKEEDREERIDLLTRIERFIFIVFRLGHTRRNYRDTEFYKTAREFNQDELTLEEIRGKLHISESSFYFHRDGTLNSKYFYDFLYEKFNGGEGYYEWGGLRYFLYEYELYLRSKSVGEEVGWGDLPGIFKDQGSIEHVLPQVPRHDSWRRSFETVKQRDYPRYSDSLGNLLLLSQSVNSVLRNDSFTAKKLMRTPSGETVGYSTDSYSAREVSKYEDWGPGEIRERGFRLLRFMEKRWGFEFENDRAREDLLFLSERRGGDS